MAFDRAESQILATLFALELRPEEWWHGQPGRLTRETVWKHVERFWPPNLEGSEVEEPDPDPRRGAFERLAAQGLLSERDGELTLSAKGREAGADLRAVFRRQRFDEVLAQAEQSEAYRIFCQRSSKLDLRAFSPLDAVQLEAVLAALALSPRDRFLDAGCATGHVAEEIARRTGAAVVGVDQAPEAIRLAAERTAEDPRASFSVLDLSQPFGRGHGDRDCSDRDRRDRERRDRGRGDGGSLDAGSFQAVLAIDSLAFLDDLEAALGRLLTLLAPGGRLVALTLEGADSADEAPTAHALTQLGLDFEQDEFTDRARSVMRARSFAASALRGAFRREGFELLGLALAQEAERLSPLLQSGRLRRYLYRVVSP